MRGCRAGRRWPGRQRLAGRLSRCRRDCSRPRPLHSRASQTGRGRRRRALLTHSISGCGRTRSHTHRPQTGCRYTVLQAAANRRFQRRHKYLLPPEPAARRRLCLARSVFGERPAAEPNNERIAWRGLQVSTFPPAAGWAVCDALRAVFVAAGHIFIAFRKTQCDCFL